MIGSTRRSVTTAHATRPLRFLAAALFLAAWILSAAPSNAGWERLKSLVGEWDTAPPSGQPVHISYRLISDGTALLETQTADESEMVTIYNPDGKDVILTHYCSHGNEPRMRARVPSGEIEKLDFRLTDIANLPSPTALHRNRLVVTFLDPRHFTQEWTSLESGKSRTETLHFTRTK